MDVKTWRNQHCITKVNYYHVRKVREACLLSVCEDSGVSFVELEQPASAGVISETANDASAGAVIKRSNGFSIELYNIASQELIQKILRACTYAQ